MAMTAGPEDDGAEVELPLGAPLEVRLPSVRGRWVPDGGTVHVRFEDVPDQGGTTARLTAVGLGTDAVVLRTEDGQEYRLTVTVVEPLFEE